MSPLFASHYCVAVAPERIELTRRRPGFRRSREALRRAGLAPAGGSGSWEFALAALADLLAEDPPIRGTLKFVLSSHWVRYLIVPWNSEIRSPDEFALYVRASFERVHGEAASGWEIRHDPAASGCARLACAVDRKLLEAIDQLVLKAGCTLASVQPYLMHAFNPLSGDIGGKNFVFVLGEPGRATLLSAVAGNWRAVRNTAIGSRGEGLKALVERELQLFENEPAAPPEVYLHAPQLSAAELPADEAGRVRIVPTCGSADYAMAWGTEPA